MITLKTISAEAFEAKLCVASSTHGNRTSLAGIESSHHAMRGTAEDAADSF
jgi:hypothetical protein